MTKTLLDRINRRIKKQANGCQLWTGYMLKGLVPVISIQSSGSVSVRRYLAIHEGIIPEDCAKNVTAACGDRRCVAPAHVCTGRTPWNGPLTADRVREIRKLHKGGMLQREIAERFGVTGGLVSDVCCRRTWRHVP